MTVNMNYVDNRENAEKVLHLYLEDPRKLGYQKIANEIGTSYHNVMGIVMKYVDGERRDVERRLRASKAKLASLNPMFGKNGELHHNYIGEIGDGHGYLQVKRNGRYVLEHRNVMAEALGLESIPDWIHVHHIDGNKQNNHIDNLALVTNCGHGKLHKKRPRSDDLPMWVKWECGILKLPMTTRTLPED